jgi:hypothetical protein
MPYQVWLYMHFPLAAADAFGHSQVHRSYIL